jgi:hypothetical protein
MEIQLTRRLRLGLPPNTMAWKMVPRLYAFRRSIAIEEHSDARRGGFDSAALTPLAIALKPSIISGRTQNISCTG